MWLTGFCAIAACSGDCKAGTRSAATTSSTAMAIRTFASPDLPTCPLQLPLTPLLLLTGCTTPMAEQVVRFSRPRFSSRARLTALFRSGRRQHAPHRPALVPHDQSHATDQPRRRHLPSTRLLSRRSSRSLLYLSLSSYRAFRRYAVTPVSALQRTRNPQLLVARVFLFLDAPPL